MTRSELPRRALLTAAAAVAATAAAGPAAASGALPRPSAAGRQEPATIDNHFWSTASDWLQGRASGIRVVAGSRPGIRIAAPAGVAEYTDPHTGTTAAWEYATWTSPLHRSKVPATELIASWNARTPAGTWLQVEAEGVYADGARTPGTCSAGGPRAIRTSGAPPSTTRATTAPASGPTRSRWTTPPPAPGSSRTACA